MSRAPRLIPAVLRARGSIRAPGPLAPAELRRGLGLAPKKIPEPSPSAALLQASHPAGGELRILPDGIDLSSYQLGLLSNSRRKRNILPHFWLRDNCRCVRCVNQDTMQRNFNTFDIPTNVRPLEAHIRAGSLLVTWDHDNHRSVYPWDFISNYLSHDRREPTGDYPKKRLWGAREYSSPPTVLYKKVMDPSNDDHGVSVFTSHIMRHGFVFVAGTPVSPQATEKLLERIAFVRVTHYGGFYDFTPDLAKADTAYTNLALPAHTDTTYFTEPAGLQAFHMLSHTPPPGPSSATSSQSPSSEPAEGGKSLLVDGFKAAELLRQEDPRAFEILATVRLPWHASGNKGIAISPDRRYPVLELDDAGRLHRVRWNRDDRGVVPLEDGGFSAADWFEAARKWDTILRREDMEYWVQLTPGTTLIFDNWRVLHGRSAFNGIRRICGGYINRDDFISRWRNTNFPHETVLSQVVG